MKKVKDTAKTDEIEVDGICWVVTDVIPLRDPVSCRGNRKLWGLPADVAAQVFKELDETGAQP